MANNIDELHFEVILKDTDFRERVAKDIELADKLNVRLSDALNFNKKVLQVLHLSLHFKVKKIVF